jgi:hypothetical protein
MMNRELLLDPSTPDVSESRKVLPANELPPIDPTFPVKVQSPPNVSESRKALPADRLPPIDPTFPEQSPPDVSESRKALFHLQETSYRGKNVVR